MAHQSFISDRPSNGGCRRASNNSVSCLWPPEKSPFKQTLLLIFIPPAFDLHLVTHFRTCSIFNTRLGEKKKPKNPDQHTSHDGKTLKRFCSVSTEYSLGASSSNFSAKHCSLGVFCPTLKRKLQGHLNHCSRDSFDISRHHNTVHALTIKHVLHALYLETGIAARNFKRGFKGKCKMTHST